jgi:thiamine biosynthesis protein ThiI
MPGNFDTVIVHYSEIGIKGKNRPYFEKMLVSNIKRSLGKGPEVKRLSGRIIIKPNKRSKDVRERLGKVFGISNLCLGFECKPDLKNIEDLVLKGVKSKKFRSFKIDSRRGDKKFKYTSEQINIRLGDMVRKMGFEVDLENPDLTVFVEVADKHAFVYFEKIRGLGGLPVGVSGRVVCLISSGIDSPLAAYKMMKRGLRVIFVHFHSYPSTSKKSIEKTIKLVKLLNEYQFDSGLYLVPFIGIQKEIVNETLEKYRVILYRRMMLRVAEEIAKKIRAKALVTGESVGQVASQTLDNIFVIDKASGMPILRPLVGHDKQDIINEAEGIGSYKISIQPHEDCCSLFVPKHPETHASLDKIEEMEKFIDIDNLIKSSVKKMEVRSF